MAIDTRTEHRNYPQLVPANDLRDDAPRLVVTFQMIDADVHALFVAVAQKAPTDHGHGIEAITGLQAALDDKQASDWRPALNDLTNVNTTGATNGQFLGRVSGNWVPVTLGIINISGLQTALDNKATSVHPHVISDVTGLQAALDNKAPSVHNHAIDDITGLPEALAAVGGVPAGVIVMWSGAANAIPSGWLLCDGSNGTPNLRDRFIVGAGGTYNPGDTGGAASVTLTTDQIPPHNHTGSTSSGGSHPHTVPTGTDVGGGPAIIPVLAGQNTSFQSIVSTSTDGPHAHSLTTNNTGGGGSHENRPPYYALCFIQKS